MWAYCFVKRLRLLSCFFPAYVGQTMQDDLIGPRLAQYSLKYELSSEISLYAYKNNNQNIHF